MAADLRPQIPAIELVDGIEHYRLDAGPDYPYDGPLTASSSTRWRWLEPIVRRPVRPAVLQAHSGYRGYENALVALALGEHLRDPGRLRGPRLPRGDLVGRRLERPRPTVSPASNPSGGRRRGEVDARRRRRRDDRRDDAR